MNKTFMDCYLFSGQGFTGGGWGYALNSNDSDGNELETTDGVDVILDEDKRTLAYYLLGWDSVEVRTF